MTGGTVGQWGLVPRYLRVNVVYKYMGKCVTMCTFYVNAVQTSSAHLHTSVKIVFPISLIVTKLQLCYLKVPAKLM